MKKQRDFELIDSGSIYLLRPMTKKAKAWVDDNIGSENGYQPYYPTVVMEPRYTESDVDKGVAPPLSEMQRN